MKSNKEIEKEFREWAKEHYNFITPEIEKVEVLRPYVFEFSTGSPFMGISMKGFSVFKYEDGEFKRPNKGWNKRIVDDDEAYEHYNKVRADVMRLIASSHSEDASECGLMPYDLDCGSICETCRIKEWCPLRE